MIGAIAGDIIGSVYEWDNIKTTDFPLFGKGCRFTDDTVLTVAIADSILTGEDYAVKLKEYYRRYPEAGYGASFRNWGESDGYKPYNSWGNGSAMRVSPVGWAFYTIDKVLDEARKSAEVTHNHPEGIKGAQAAASSVFLAKNGTDKDGIRDFITRNFGYNLTEPLAKIRTYYKFDVSCQGSVPQAITAFLESSDYEDAVRLAVSIGGDSDTIACITGGIAQAFYKKIPDFITAKAVEFLDINQNRVVSDFSKRYTGCASPSLS